ncbi:MAG: hypothetical protein BWZ04_01022 [Firmicutes bacterium ADurb.BinA205]|nr:MAG: hypothetical protein BWZ04_01022 [Firmicutes bacterium ADurb.BinA205]
MPNIRNLSEGTYALRQDATQISNIATEFFKEYEAIYSVFDNELEASWIGSGEKEFAANTEATKPKFKALYDLMNEYSEQLIKIADAYDSQAQEVANAANSISFD